MEPISLTVGAIAAALVAKATNKAADSVVDAGAAAAGGFVTWLRQRVSGKGREDATTALARVEDVPDSPSLLRALAEVLDRWAGEDTEFGSALEAQVHDAQARGIDIRSLTQSVRGDSNVLIAETENSSITVSGHHPPTPR